MWNSSNYGNRLNISKKDAEFGDHPGQCDSEIAILRTRPNIKRQLAKLDPEALRKELSDYGAWNEQELADHDKNLTRWLWVSCEDIRKRIPNGSCWDRPVASLPRSTKAKEE